MVPVKGCCRSCLKAVAVEQFRQSVIGFSWIAGFPNWGMSDSSFWLELEGSHDGETLFG